MRWIVACGTAFIAFCLLSGQPLRAEENDPVRLLYFERPPFLVTLPNGDVGGRTAVATKEAFARAGIPIIWQRMPINRILITIRANSGRDCSSAWSETPERASYARFTVPIITTTPLVGLVSRTSALPAEISAQALSAQPDLKLLVKKNFNYGPSLNALIAAWPAERTVPVVVEVPSLAKMIETGRADLTFLQEEDALPFTLPAGGHPAPLRLLRLTDMFKGIETHIMCSQSLPEEVIHRLNHAIAAMASAGEK